MTGSRRVVVTGVGWATPHSWSVEEGWKALSAGHSAVRPIDRFDASGFPARIAASLPTASAPPEVDLDPAADRELDVASRLALWAAGQALADSGEAPEPTGLVFTAGGYGWSHPPNLVGLPAAGGATFDAEAYVEARVRGLAPTTLEARLPSCGSAAIARRLGLRGPHLALDTACSSGAETLATAGRWIRSGRARRVVAAAGDSHVSPLGLLGFCVLGALSSRNDEPTRASRPFDRDRDGFVLGEGAGALVLESEEAARQRGARILGELRGWGSACDAYRVTDPHPDARGARLALESALRSADLQPQEIGYVNAHGTSTPANDRTETVALRSVFGDQPPPTSSTKSMIGHLVTAAGAVEAIVTLLALRDQRLPPTINFENPDPDCDLDVVPGESRPSPARHAISNSFGFGGSCTCLVLSGWETP